MSELIKAKYEELFDQQLTCLSFLDIPYEIVRALSGKKDSVISKVSTLDIAEDNLPFLPVIPIQYIGLYGLMSITKGLGLRGHTDLNPNSIKDVVEIDIPRQPYYMIDVGDRKHTFGKSSAEATNIIKGNHRSPLTIQEVIAFCILSPEELHKQNLYCLGSGYDFYVEKLSKLFIYFDRGACLSVFHKEYSCSTAEFLSCSDRV